MHHFACHYLCHMLSAVCDKGVLLVSDYKRRSDNMTKVCTCVFIPLCLSIDIFCRDFCYRTKTDIFFFFYHIGFKPNCRLSTTGLLQHVFFQKRKVKVYFFQTFQQFHDLDTELDLHRMTSGFHEAFATGVAYQHTSRERLPFRTPGSVPLLRGLARTCTPIFLNLPCFHSTFHFEYPSVLSRF